MKAQQYVEARLRELGHAILAKQSLVIKLEQEQREDVKQGINNPGQRLQQASYDLRHLKGRRAELREMKLWLESESHDVYAKTNVTTVAAPLRTEVDPPKPVRVIKTFDEARTPCPPVGTCGELTAMVGRFYLVRFPLPMTDMDGAVWETQHDATDYMRLKFLADEIEIITEGPHWELVESTEEE
jgi:hypothetical protein